MATKRALSFLLIITALLKLVATQDPECRSGDIRLVLGTEGEQYLQYCSSEEWRNLCTAGSRTFNTLSASVACRQLGYSHQGAVIDGHDCKDITVTTESYFMIRQNCQCDQQRVQDCGGIAELSVCDPCKIGLLSCQPACNDGEVRLVEGAKYNEGRVEVCVDGRWGTVCNNSQEGIAGAVCSQLGFPDETSAFVNSFGPGTIPINSCTVQSGGNLSCSLITDTSCDHSMDLGVVCRTYQQLYNELLDEISTTDPSATTDLSSTSDPPSTTGTSSITDPQPTTDLLSTVTTDPLSTSLIHEANSDSTLNECQLEIPTIIIALGAVSGVLVVLLCVTATALVLVLVYHKRRAVHNHSTTSESSSDRSHTTGPSVLYL